MRMIVRTVFLFVTLAFVGAVGASDDDGPADTVDAMDALLAVANEPVPVSSTCYPAVEHASDQRVRDLLAAELSLMRSGANALYGECGGDHCTLSIGHVEGAQRAGTVIAFMVADAKARPETLECILAR